jgi:hypothetical protein
VSTSPSPAEASKADHRAGPLPGATADRLTDSDFSHKSPCVRCVLTYPPRSRSHAAMSPSTKVSGTPTRAHPRGDAILQIQPEAAGRNWKTRIFTEMHSI